MACYMSFRAGRWFGLSGCLCAAVSLLNFCGCIALLAQSPPKVFPAPDTIATWSEELDLAPPAMQLDHISGVFDDDGGNASSVGAEVVQLGPAHALMLIDGGGTGGSDFTFYLNDPAGLHQILDGGGGWPYLLQSSGQIADVAFLNEVKGSPWNHVTYYRYRFAQGGFHLYACEEQRVNESRGIELPATRIPCGKGSAPGGAIFPMRGPEPDPQKPSTADLAMIGKAIVGRVGPFAEDGGSNFDRGDAVIVRHSPQCDSLENCPVYVWPKDASFTAPVLLKDEGWGVGLTPDTKQFVLAHQVAPDQIELMRFAVHGGRAAPDACETVSGSPSELLISQWQPVAVACE